jgi:hypothetical protein
VRPRSLEGMSGFSTLLPTSVERLRHFDPHYSRNLLTFTKQLHREVRGIGLPRDPEFLSCAVIYAMRG